MMIFGDGMLREGAVPSSVVAARSAAALQRRRRMRQARSNLKKNKVWGDFSKFFETKNPKKFESFSKYFSNFVWR